MSKDYIHSVVGLLEDALTDRDHVHRQTAAAIVKHLTIGVAGLGYEEALTHLLNLVWPNIFETSPHVIGGMMDAIEAMRLGIGPGPVLSYVLQGMYHPARRVREVYWRIYSEFLLCILRLFPPFILWTFLSTWIDGLWPLRRYPHSWLVRRNGPLLPQSRLSIGFDIWTGLHSTSSHDMGMIV